MQGAAVRTTCPYCGVGCGVLASPRPDGSVKIAGDPEHPANLGRLCSKGAALGETLSLEGRLLHPTVNGVRVEWGVALDLVAARFAAAAAEHGPDSVAFYVSGQLLTEDYYVANKLMKGFIGSANIDTNSRLCMASSVAGHRRAFGSDTVPGLYEDLEEADLVVLVGSNLAWCHPVLFQRLQSARERRGTKLVAIDPRATATTEAADLHLSIAPGADVALFNGLFSYLDERGFLDAQFIDEHTSGFAAALEAARAQPVPEIARVAGLSASVIDAFYRMFAQSERVVTIYSQGVNQSSAGTDKVNAIINCHLATGRIGRPGMGPFSVTGQPNAMGGREVGGLANMLAAHMDLDNPLHRRLVQGFWRAPRLAGRAGLKAVDLFRAVGEGRIKALWIIGTNPADSLPDADRVREAIRACPFVVVSDVEAETDTAALAHVLLPALAWGEKAGTVTNSERRISRQRAFLPAPGEAMPDWRQLCEVAKRMGFAEEFAYERPHEIFAEHAALTALDNAGARDLDLGAYADIPNDAYDRLAPFCWPARAGEPRRARRFFGDGRFHHPDGKARFVATPHRAPAKEPGPQYPLWLNTGRIRDQWHTMTRSGKAARLLAQFGEPFLEIHPENAAALQLSPADLVEAESALGRVVLRAVVTPRARRGSVFAPIHWTDQQSSAGRVGALVASVTDPVSGQPESKATPVRLRRFEAAWHAFAVSTRPIDIKGADYFAVARAKRGWRAELAGLAAPDEWEAYARRTLALAEDAELLSYADAATGLRRFVAFAQGVMIGALFAAREPVSCARDFIADQLGEEKPTASRMRLLTGRPGADERNRGPTVCACFDVGRNEILDAVAAGCVSVEGIGEKLKAGTNCGACRGEIARLSARSAGAESGLSREQSG